MTLLPTSNYLILTFHLPLWMVSMRQRLTLLLILMITLNGR